MVHGWERKSKMLYAYRLTGRSCDQRWSEEERKARWERRHGFQGFGRSSGLSVKVYTCLALNYPMKSAVNVGVLLNRLYVLPNGDINVCDDRTYQV